MIQDNPGNEIASLISSLERGEFPAALLSSEEWYMAMFNNMSSAVIVFRMAGDGTDFTVRELNRAAERMIGTIRGEVLVRPLGQVFPPEESRGLMEVLLRVWRTGRPEHFPVRLGRQNRLAAWRKSHIYRLPSGEVVALFDDVTERNRAEEAVRQEKEKAEITLESIQDAVIVTGVDGTIEYMNPVAEELTGWDKVRALGRPLALVLNLVHEVSGRPLENPLPRALPRRRVAGLTDHTLLVRPDGRQCAVETSASPITSPSGSRTGDVLVLRDVDEKRAAIRQLEHRAYHDALTGLPNRLLFQDRLLQAIARARREKLLLAVGFLDLDHFKTINDTLGHAMGDRLLIAVGDRLKAGLRADDTVARQGGDEFLILLAGLKTRAQAGVVARKINDCIRRPFDVGGKEVSVSSSVGIAVFPDDGTDMETLVRLADTAMYSAKALGRNNYQFAAPGLAKDG